MITLKKFDQRHQAFLATLYRSTREAELRLTPWTEEQKKAFCHLQQLAQLRDYGSKPGARHEVIYARRQPVGRLFTWESEDEVRLADISLLPEFRGQGIGRTVLAGLLATARRHGKPVSLHVDSANPARRLYERLGFQTLRTEQGREFMAWQPGPQ